MIKVNGENINVTIFPDNTSQVWKLQDSIINAPKFDIEFNFENEGEIFQLQQLVKLIRLGRVPCPITLHMPYLPYGRQDKNVSNETTFALQVFADVINNLHFDKVSTVDAHSDAAERLFNSFTSRHVSRKILDAMFVLGDFETDSFNIEIAFPDTGAKNRYKEIAYHGKSRTPIVGNKVRNQLTGHIESYKIEGNPEGKKILIVDDICDGGMTFKLMSNELYKQGAVEVHLYVSHGIFSKGLETLRASGIQRIFTKEGEVKNEINTNIIM